MIPEERPFKIFIRRNKTVKNLLIDTILDLYYLEKGYENKDERYMEFMDILYDNITPLDDDLSNYSKDKLKIVFMMNGFDIDELYGMFNRIKKDAVDKCIGIISLMKPITLENNVIALLEF